MLLHALRIKHPKASLHSSASVIRIYWLDAFFWKSGWKETRMFSL